MNVEKVTPLPPIDLGFRVDARRPILPLAMEVNRAGCAAPHAHPRGQLIYASHGIMRVVCSGTIWIVPPSQAVWVPPMIEHEVYFPAKVSMRNLFFDPSKVARLPRQCTVLAVSPLLRELILKVMPVGCDYAPGGSTARLMAVLLDELSLARPTPLCLPTGQDARLLRVTSALIRHPGDDRSIEAWAELACISSRTLARLFVVETGLTFADWRKRLRLIEALKRLSKGQSVTRVALDLGYQSSSAFIEMFRKALGSSPRKYLRTAL